MRVKHRVQEWAADRIDRVQYPRTSQFREEAPPKADFATGLTLLVVGGAATVVGLAGLAFVLFFVLPAFFA